MIYEFKCAATQKPKYQIMLSSGKWFQNLFGSAWYSTNKADAEYELKVLRKIGAI